MSTEIDSHYCRANETTVKDGSRDNQPSKNEKESRRFLMQQ